MKPTRRRDYLSNARKRAENQRGCPWCGVDVPRAPYAGYCSDACIQADMEGIDDEPPIMVLQPGNQGRNSEYVARKFAQYNESYGKPDHSACCPPPGTPSGDGDSTGGGPYRSGSAIEEFDGSDD